MKTSQPGRPTNRASRARQSAISNCFHSRAMPRRAATLAHHGQGLHLRWPLPNRFGDRGAFGGGRKSSSFSPGLRLASIQAISS